jgi:hypothetical protein
MDPGEGAIDPRRISGLAELARALTVLRRRAARKGQVQLSVRDLAVRTGRPPSTLQPYLRGERLSPADVYEDMLRALGVADRDMRSWLDAWDRIADARQAGRGGASSRATATKAGPSELLVEPTDMIKYGVKTRHACNVGLVTGDIRRVAGIDVWVNSENTAMEMARVEEYSISAIIRYRGATLDHAGRVIDDLIASELERQMAGHAPVAPGTAVVTGPGELARHNGVRYVIHVAAVHGEPGSGYRQIQDVGGAVTNVLEKVEGIGADPPVRSILFPILGVGVGRGDVEPTVRGMLDAAIGHFIVHPDSHLATVWLLASTIEELTVGRHVLSGDGRLEGPV